MNKLLGIVLIAQYICLGTGNGLRFGHYGYWSGIYTAGDIPYFCRLPAVTGPCLALEVRWAYNAWIGKCVQFTYGGCDGNANSFASKAECDGCCPTNSDPTMCPPVNITLCQQPVDVNKGLCGGGKLDLFRTPIVCGSACPLICKQPVPDVCTLECVTNICQCKPGFFRRVSDCQCVDSSDCP